jgi:hypothetical protein
VTHTPLEIEQLSEIPEVLEYAGNLKTNSCFFAFYNMVFGRRLAEISYHKDLFRNKIVLR